MSWPYQLVKCEMSENYFKILEVDKMSEKGHEAGFEPGKPQFIGFIWVHIVNGLEK